LLSQERGEHGRFFREHREVLSLRDQLKAGLSQATPEPGTPPVAELAERIKALKAAHTIDAAPERTAPRRLKAEEPVTARIRRRAESLAAPLPPADPEPAAPPPVATAPIEEPPPAIHPFPQPLTPAAARQEPAYREHVARQRKNGRQLSLF
jgi:hypothetical protein